MGLQLRQHLFYDVTPEQVFAAYAEFYGRRGQALVNSGDDYWQFDLHEQHNGWTALWLDGGWEKRVRREARLFVSRELRCRGLFAFVYDGDYWGYELFRDGEVLDRFVQDPLQGWGFVADAASEDLSGNPQRLAQEFPWLQVGNIVPYLVQMPSDDPEPERYVRERRRLDVLARPGDEFGRFDQCAILDFLRMLGVGIELHKRKEEIGTALGTVRLLSPIWRAFWIEKQRTFEEHEKMYPRKGGG